MLRKPKYLRPEHAAAFTDRSVAEAYPKRPPYPDELFSLLLGLISDSPRAVLELGCGTGEVARRLAPSVDYVDAVDPSAPMIEVGKALPGGDAENLRWVRKTAEEFHYPGAYALVVAAESLHWMEWDEVLPLVSGALSADGRLALVLDRKHHAAWDAAALEGIVPRYSTNSDYEPYSLLEELEKRDLFEAEKRVSTKPVPFAQALDDYVEFWHSRSGFSRERMGSEHAAAFDEEVRRLVEPHSADGVVRYDVSVEVAWGRPRAP